MRISHACAGCGSDLTYLRAAPDPHYHLPIVVCPSCDLAVVRRKPEMSRIAKRYRRGRSSWWALSNRVSLLVISLLVTVSATEALAIDALDRWNGVTKGWAPSFGEEGFVFRDPLHDRALIVAGIGFWVGSWLVGTLPHWNPWKAVGAFGALAALFVTALAGAGAALSSFAISKGLPWPDSVPTAPELLVHLGAIGVCMLVAAGLGLPAGMLLRKSFDKRTSRRMRKALLKARSARAETC